MGAEACSMMRSSDWTTGMSASRETDRAQVLHGARLDRPAPAGLPAVDRPHVARHHMGSAHRLEGDAAQVLVASLVPEVRLGEQLLDLALEDRQGEGEERRE